MTSNEDFGDRHLSYWSSSHFFKDETTNHPERKEKSFIQYWFLHTAPLYITPKYFIFHSHTTTNACNILSLHRLSLCLVNIKSQVREYQKNKKKHPFRHGVCRSINPRVQSAANSTIEKSFLFSSRLFRYAYNRMTRDVYYNNNDMPNIESATRCLIGIKGSGEYVILNICLPIYVELELFSSLLTMLSILFIILI